ncbi:hypothetical protein HK100_002726 [Physocladia obscura]|uniref:Uncharacterized protein n=1 Tax=Physocladia obscura TaxID=109957 RepID=A0AAD5SVE7_9FUNG|nr:hypothetical protein HK100_002726 [Physocladia obscura]
MNEIIKNSARFFADTPGLSNLPKTNRIARLIANPPAGLTKQTMEPLILACVNGARIVVHATLVYHVIPLFLEYKNKHGSNIEKAFYQRHTVESLLQRLVVDRPLAFYGPSNTTKLRTGALPDPSAWLKVGTDFETQQITLEDYMSFDEIMLAALIGVSSPTTFINPGQRNNRAVPTQNASLFNSTGILVGLVGARFEMSNHMESQYILISKTRSTPTNGFGRDGYACNACEFERLAILACAFGNQDADFPERWYFPSYDEVATLMTRAGQEGISAHMRMSQRFVRLDAETFFNVEAYRRRIRLSAETLLLEANQRSIEETQKNGLFKGAFVHVVGLGLGVWQILNIQNQIYVDAFGQALRRIAIPHVKVVNFSWIEGVHSCGGYKNGEELVDAGGNKIIIEFSKRNPADRFAYFDEDKLLVASFAWDGNAFVGNEYWDCLLTASGDPAAVASSIIGETLNPLINADFPNNVAILDPDLNSRSITTKIEAIEARHYNIKAGRASSLDFASSFNLQDSLQIMNLWNSKEQHQMKPEIPEDQFQLMESNHMPQLVKSEVQFKIQAEDLFSDSAIVHPELDESQSTATDTNARGMPDNGDSN